MRYHISQNDCHQLINVLARILIKRNPHALLVGMQTGAATVESSMEFLQKLKMELPYDPEILILGIFPKETETLTQKNICTPMFIAAYLQ